MAEYIEREKVRDEFDQCVLDGTITSVEDTGKFLRDFPGADVAPVVHGRWDTNREDIEWGNSIKRKFCTNCGEKPHFDKEARKFILSDYCPNCGARMDGGAADGI